MLHKLSAFRPGNALKAVSLTTLAFVVICGMLMTFTISRPFWLDEWFIIYNIKTRTVPELWGELSFIQQFPRVYLQLVKHFSELLDYSYFSLRLPSFLTHVAAMLFCYRLSGRLFKDRPLQRFLWVMLYISFGTALEYYVQVKPYTMDMFLGLVGIWQLLALKELADDPHKTKGLRYAILCLSFVAAPFFSYTYPIVIAPALLLMPVYVLKNKSTRPMLHLCVPVLLAGISIITFYLVDVKQVMRDQGMQTGWADYMLQNGFDAKVFFSGSYQLFVNMGAGDLFGHICGVLGVIAFIYATVRTIRCFFRNNSDTIVLMAYAALFTWLLLGLFVAGKIPLGAHRVNAFATPALAFLIVNFLSSITGFQKLKYVSPVLTVVLFVGASGNVFSTFINQYSSDEQQKKITIYRNLSEALDLSRTGNIPLIATPETTYPHTAQMPADEMLLTHPSYHMQQPVQIYKAADLENAKRLQDSLSIDQAVFTNGNDVSVLKKES